MLFTTKDQSSVQYSNAADTSDAEAQCNALSSCRLSLRHKPLQPLLAADHRIMQIGVGEAVVQHVRLHEGVLIHGLCGVSRGGGPR